MLTRHTARKQQEWCLVETDGNLNVIGCSLGHDGSNGPGRVSCCLHVQTEISKICRCYKVIGITPSCHQRRRRRWWWWYFYCVEERACLAKKTYSQPAINVIILSYGHLFIGPYNIFLFISLVVFQRCKGFYKVSSKLLPKKLKPPVGGCKHKAKCALSRRSGLFLFFSAAPGQQIQAWKHEDVEITETFKRRPPAQATNVRRLLWYLLDVGCFDWIRLTLWRRLILLSLFYSFRSLGGRLTNTSVRRCRVSISQCSLQTAIHCCSAPTGGHSTIVLLSFSHL